MKKIIQELPHLYNVSQNKEVPMKVSSELKENVMLYFKSNIERGVFCKMLGM